MVKLRSRRTNRKSSKLLRKSRRKTKRKSRIKCQYDNNKIVNPNFIVSKWKNNQIFVNSIKKLSSENKYFVLDEIEGNSIAALISKGINQEQIYVANECPEVCKKLKKKYPQVNVFKEKAEYFLNKNKRLKFNGIYWDSCNAIQNCLQSMINNVKNHLEKDASLFYTMTQRNNLRKPKIKITMEKQIDVMEKFLSAIFPDLEVIKRPTGYQGKQFNMMIFGGIRVIKKPNVLSVIEKKLKEFQKNKSLINRILKHI